MSDENKPMEFTGGEMSFRDFMKSGAMDPEQRRALKATPVKVTATWPDHEFKMTAPLWMLHVFAKMVREFNAQAPGVEYKIGPGDYRIVPEPDTDA